MDTKTHGRLSVALIGIAITIAAIFAGLINILLCVGYLLFSLLSFTVIITAYCAKCPCKSHCPHLLPGLLASKINRQPGQYNKLELSGLIIALILLLLMPNIWLWQFTSIWIIYWILVIAAAIEIRKFVCKPCENIHCPLNQIK